MQYLFNKREGMPKYDCKALKTTYKMPIKKDLKTRVQSNGNRKAAQAVEKELAWYKKRLTIPTSH